MTTSDLNWTIKTAKQRRRQETRRAAGKGIAMACAFMAAGAGATLGLAQLTVWGLSLYHVHSGIAGAVLLILVASSVTGGTRILTISKKN